jgi:hypothetical protein
MHPWKVFFDRSNPNARSYCMFIGMAAPPYEYSELEGCMDTDRDPPFLFTGSYREA